MVGWLRGVALALAVMAAPSWAEELGVILNGRAVHLEGEGYNENNAGLGLQYEFDRRQGYVPFVTVAGLTDSDKNMSYYAGGGFKGRLASEPRLADLHLDLGGMAFLMSRKDYHDNRPFAGVLPVLTLGISRVELNATYVPKLTAHSSALLFFQLAYKVDME